MYKFWPSPALFAFAAMLVVKGEKLHDEAQKQLSEVQTYRLHGQVFESGRGTADRDLVTARHMQIGGVALAGVGLVMLGLGVAHGRVQAQTLKSRLAVTYTIVPAGGPAPAGLLTEEQAAALLRTRYPTLAKDAVEKLHREFAEKRRQNPVTLWHVKDLQVSEVPG